MDEVKPDTALLDEVIKRTVTAVEQSKEQMFEVSEGARQEAHSLTKALQSVEAEWAAVQQEAGELEEAHRVALQRLTEVRQNFSQVTEEQVRLAYEDANQKQLSLFVAKERETHLRRRHADLQQRLENLRHTVKHAEELTTQVGVVLGYLAGDLNKVGAELEKAQHRQRLGLQIIQAQEEERKRVAREIHDGPAQMMAHLVFRVEMAERFLSEDVEAARRELHELKGAVRSSLTEVRKIIFDLRPMVLDDLGLIPTLRKYVDNFRKAHRIRPDLQLIGQETRLDPAMEVALFRLVQEALSNVAKHAQATDVHICMAFCPKRVTVEVMDNGVGFDYDPDAPVKGDRFGITGMRERVQLLAGDLDIQTSPGAGTHIVMTIPTKRSKDDATT